MAQIECCYQLMIKDFLSNYNKYDGSSYMQELLCSNAIDLLSKREVNYFSMIKNGIENGNGYCKICLKEIKIFEEDHFGYDYIFPQIFCTNEACLHCATLLYGCPYDSKDDIINAGFYKADKISYPKDDIINECPKNDEPSIYV